MLAELELSTLSKTLFAYTIYKGYHEPHPVQHDLSGDVTETYTCFISGKVLQTVVVLEATCDEVKCKSGESNQRIALW